MAVDSVELQLAAARQRYETLCRRAETQRDLSPVVQRSLAELSTALEEVRVTHEQMLETRQRLERTTEEMREHNRRYWELFDEIPLPCVVTDAQSTITEVNKAAADLFNVSQRFLVGKALSVFVCEDRSPFLATCSRVAEQRQTATMPLRLRPRERAPLTVSARATGTGTQVRWLLTPELKPSLS